MEDWILDKLSKYDLKTVFIGFSDHALRDKNLKSDDVEKVLETIRTGKVVEEKSDKLRKVICFKRYFENNITYFVVAGLQDGFLRVVTVIKVEGRV